MTQDVSFAPKYGDGVTVAPTTASATSTLGEGSKQVCFTNTGDVTCYVRIFTGSSTATAADYPILSKTQIVLSKPTTQDKVAYISASGTGALHIIAGEGF